MGFEAPLPDWPSPQAIINNLVRFPGCDGHNIVVLARTSKCPPPGCQDNDLPSVNGSKIAPFAISSTWKHHCHHRHFLFRQPQYQFSYWFSQDVLPPNPVPPQWSSRWSLHRSTGESALINLPSINLGEFCATIIKDVYLSRAIPWEREGHVIHLFSQDRLPPVLSNADFFSPLGK